MKKDFSNHVLAYVIMPNHIHFLIYLNENSLAIHKLISNGKRFMVYEIVKRLREQNDNQLLAALAEGWISTKQKKENAITYLSHLSIVRSALQKSSCYRK